MRRYVWRRLGKDVKQQLNQLVQVGCGAGGGALLARRYLCLAACGEPAGIRLSAGSKLLRQATRSAADESQKTLA